MRLAVSVHSIVANHRRSGYGLQIKYDPNPTAVSRTRDINSFIFILALQMRGMTRTADERDDFIDLLFTELMLRGLSVEGDLEELRERLLSEVILEKKYRANLQELVPTDLYHCPASQDSVQFAWRKLNQNQICYDVVNGRIQ